MKKIDAKGLSCPQPMLMAKKAMEAGTDDKIEIQVDCAASVENIGRAAKQIGWNLTVLSQDGDEAVVELNKR
ncbi:sulfurtransferase TusA family protein [Desulfovibrio sp. OttesenSCG-928-C06]|nr:sulfurtransferase TusA family protein [Desulfovibrio sp. OttesenSCG-928-C06]